MTDITSPAPSAGPLPRALQAAFAMLLLVLALGALDQTIVATALQTIARRLGGSAHLSWVFSAYLIAATVAVPLLGRLADLHGTRAVLLGALALFTAGSAACGLARSIDGLVIARGVQGAGGGGLLTLSMMVVVRGYPAAARGRLQGLLGGVYGLATMAGPLVGGLLVEHLSWRWAFLLNLPFGVLAAAVLARTLPREPKAPGGRFDAAGAALLAAALACLMLGTRRGEAADVSGGAAVLASGLALAGAFVAWQARTPQPLLPLSLFRDRAFTAAALLSASSGFAMLAAVAFLPQYYQLARGLSAAGSGLSLMPLMLGMTLGSVMCGRSLAGAGALRSIGIGSSVLAAAAFGALAALAGAPTRRRG